MCFLILCTHVQLACVFYIIYRSSVVFFCVSHYARTKPRTISVCTYNLLVCFIIVATALRHSYWNFYSVFKCVFFSYARTTCLCVYIYLPLKCSDFFCLYTRATCLCVLYLFTAQCKCCAFFDVFWNDFETLILGFLFSAQVFVLFLVRTVSFFFF